jgi:hypothetical protein
VNLFEEWHGGGGIPVFRLGRMVAQGIYIFTISRIFMPCSSVVMLRR